MSEPGTTEQEPGQDLSAQDRAGQGTTDGGAGGTVLPTSVSPAARRHLDRLAASRPARPRAFPAPDDREGWLRHVAEADEWFRAAVRLDHLPPADEVRQVGSAVAYVQRAHDADPDGPVVLDLHGGGLLYGAGEVCRVSAVTASARTGLVAWGVDYRMPPLHPYPAALDDALAAYRALLSERGPGRVVVCGGSAGGNLAAALLLRARDEGLPMPAALVLLTPEVDLTESGDSFVTNAPHDLALASLREVNALYAGGADLAHPYLSPLFGDLEGLPPTLLQSGTRDLFLSNTVRMHRRLRAAGVAAELHVFEGMPHGGFGGGAPEDAELDAEVRAFVDRALRARHEPS
ncbi:alpha/beta hydrolase fold domain-containing protein [Isoptericola sp. NPDC057653]|uniref:alpha/beta hydrolase fold domain-containing protein n=1 Tax=Isoptericola sp. NPDC057653 TaxID=3346195 RepID=UPI00369A9346